MGTSPLHRKPFPAVSAGPEGVLDYWVRLQESVPKKLTCCSGMCVPHWSAIQGASSEAPLKLGDLLELLTR